MNKKVKILLIVLLILVLIAGLATGGYFIYKNIEEKDDEIRELKKDKKDKKDNIRDSSSDQERKKNPFDQTEKKDPFGVEREKEEQKKDDNNKSSEYIVVPDVIGKPKKEAIKILEEAGFFVNKEIHELEDPKIEAGLIVKTSPSVGFKRVKGSPITLYVSVGPKIIGIGNYTGKNVYETKGVLEGEGLFVYIEEKEVSDTSITDRSVIIGQSVAPGSNLVPRDSITLYIPKITETYPDFTVGEYTLEDVKSFCDKYEIKLEVLYDEPDGTQIPSGKMPKEGTVFYQSRIPGSAITKGSDLTIKIARY